MPISISGSGTITGISAGGLPDASIVAADIADANITAAKLDGAQTGSAPIYGCRAWVNFDGTRNAADTGASTNGANVKIRASGNVSSVLKNATGDYTVNFTTAMVDANYSAVVNGKSIENSNQGNFYGRHVSTSPTTSAYRMQVYQSNLGSGLTSFDQDYITVAIFR
jgi:hypothetical protein